MVIFFLKNPFPTALSKYQMLKQKVNKKKPEITVRIFFHRFILFCVYGLCYDCFHHF
jgi:hypothetical protein